MSTYKAYSAASLMINYAIGTGVLNLPKTVAKASIIVSFIVITVITFFGYLLGRYTLDALSRTFALKRLEGNVEKYQQKEDDMVIYPEGDAQQKSNDLLTDNADYSLPNDHTFEVCELCGVYYGQAGFFVYQIAVILYVFGIVWGYTSVVAQSLSSVIPFGPKWHCGDPCDKGGYPSQCNVAYFVWNYVAVIYSSILVFVDISNQKILQSIFTICRFVAVGGMALVAFVAIFVSPFDVGTVATSYPYVKDTPIFAFTFISFGSVVSSSIFAVILHYCIPEVLRPTELSQQKFLNHAFTGSFGIIYVIMAFVAYPSALYFGTDGAQLITLNLIKWDGKSWNASSQPAWAAAIAYIIRLLPPIYVLGAIPLNGISITNNILLLAPKMQDKKWFSILIRLLSIIPAGVLSGFFRCIGSIIDLTGLFGFVILLAPAFCLIKARKQCQEKFGTKKTPFSGFCDYDPLIITIMVVFFIGFGFTLYAVIMNFINA
ncbi:putative Amino acid transporter [Spironucleus salmonicida]|uniref:Amino acid transporter n=1 Tax=Spironucleus salmonicida TaxID=348837 RepID=V6LV23_9EUKA|nr:putative Amino acid transporter [Spironucleus salmonicida]|eukprot:EST48430.1 Amino acid transporter family protein [Spironucleus salmonicida]